MTILKGYHSRWGTLKNPHCSMAMSAKLRSKFAALQKIFEWDKKNKQTKNQTLSYILKNIIGNLEGLISHVLNTCMDGLQKTQKHS